MDTNLVNKIKSNTTVKYIFCDYYDTVIHRTVHPLQPLVTWAKLIKSRFEIDTTVKNLYQIRKQAVNTIEKATGLVKTELDYEAVNKEIYNQLLHANFLKANITFKTFFASSAEADYESESSVQYLNKEMVATLKYLKENGYMIFCVSDFYTDENSISKLIDFHGITHLYDKIIVSSTQKASKENRGVLYKQLLENEKIAPEQVFMIGDNKKSDYINAKLQGLDAYHLKRYKQKFLQKCYFFLFLLKGYLF